MTKIEDFKTYICNVCNKSYKTIDEARNCELGHDIVLLPIERSDLKRLILFIRTGEGNILTSTLVELLEKYNKLKID